MTSKKTIVAPSMLSADFAKLGEESEKMLRLGAEWLHLDVMDGHFVPNITIGAPVVKSIRSHLGGNSSSGAFLDCHLMVTNPELWVSDFSKAGASNYTFHIETTTTATNSRTEEKQDKDNTVKLINDIHAHGMKAGIAIKPKTSWEEAIPYLHLVDLCLVMTVEPGFGGQSFMHDMMNKVAQIRKRFPLLDIQVDGGLDPETVIEAVNAGANVIVAGSSVFKAKDIAQVIQQLHYTSQR